MGHMISRWWWGGDPDARNETSGMSLRDIQNVQRSWMPIYSNAYGNGFLIFSRLFQADPTSKSFFKNIANASETEMAANIHFRAHIINIMSSMNTSIQNLRTPDVVVAWMEKIGETHRKLHIHKSHFWVMKDVLMNILQNDLKLRANVIESWDRYITFTFQHILSKLEY